MTKWFNGIMIKYIQELLFPKKCIGCGKFGGYVCQECEVGMWEEEQICPSCCRNSRYGLLHPTCTGPLDGLTCLWVYEGLTRKLIQKIKYGGFYDSLEFLISNFKLSNQPEFFNFLKFLNQKPVVVPIPLHTNRLRKRGFNQAEMIANLVARSWTLDARNLLIRTKDTSQQVGKTRNERLKSMDGAFALKSSIKDLGSILLVDDVWTTGATMSEAAKVLKKTGCSQVWGFVLAR